MIYLRVVKKISQATLLALCAISAGCAAGGQGSAKMGEGLSSIFSGVGSGESKPAFITGIKTSAEGDKAQVIISVSAPCQHTAYKLNNPTRLAVELTGVTHNLISPVIPVKEGLLDNIHLVNFERAGTLRMEIGVTKLFQYEVKATGGAFYITIAKDKSPEALALEEANKKIGELTEENKALRVKLAEASSSREPSSAGQTEPAPPKVDEKEEVLKTIVRWKEAWERKDLEKYRSYYTTVFSVDGQSMEDWLAEKQKKFRRSKEIKIDIGDMSVAVEGEKASAEFSQMYSSGKYSDSGVKNLSLVKTADGWKIETETFRPNK